MEELVNIKSAVRGRICVYSPEVNFRRVWERKGAVKKVPFKILQEVIYDSGVEYLFKEGMLQILDKGVAVRLGLVEDEKEEELLSLTDAQRKRLLTTAPVAEFDATLAKLSKEQIEELADTAIDLEVTDLKRLDLLKKYTDKNIMRAVMLNRDNKEA